MLRDVDKTWLTSADRLANERGWAAAATEPLRSRLLVRVSERRPLLVPQVILLAAAEALEGCAPGAPRNDLFGLDAILRNLLSIGQEEPSHRPRPSGLVWGGYDEELASELVANQHFNKSPQLAHLITEADFFWRREWPDKLPKKIRNQLPSTPADLYQLATGVTFDDLISIALHLWTQAEINNYTRFPFEFFEKLGVDENAIRRFLEITSIDSIGLAAEIAAERNECTIPSWSFNSFRRYPIVRLETGEYLVLRLGFMVERALGVPPSLDVAQSLGPSSRQVVAFRAAAEAVFENSVGQTLSRMFNSGQLSKRVFDEVNMQKAWMGRSGQKPKVCDFAVDCGDVWLLIECTSRRIAADVVNASGGRESLERELDAVLTDRKAKQLNSTVHLIRHHLQKLCGYPPPDGTRIVPLVVVPNEGLGWNEVVAQQVREKVRKNSGLTHPSALPFAIITLRELRSFEALMETGQADASMLVRWRVAAPDMPLEHFIDQQGLPLNRPAWETNSFSLVTDQLIRVMQSRGMDE
ncbi:hypothetical protein MO973_38945 [Paenibacillus sp. TRM 82003]|uniref:hypothetical protein n=1 Tax=Kineococcus sp. TRM81007 TaxID=2925831 RepID=UPI001F5760D8|nr:hypothetical protein [Kineococcus sp. TRM81007]MCI2239540.1 hypothetical protein [Kineococcus sp. TRM81007]MCI3926178.1 hypothetical protein [Paenibacillus sp. TRM 82003]